MNIQNISLTETGIEKFNCWFADVARDGVRMDAVMLDALNVIENRAGSGESFSYELHGQFTVSGRPELLILDPDDVEIELCAEEND